MDQRSLVKRAQKGDRDAFTALCRPAASRLDAAARLILRDAELARDAVQETLIRAWRDLPGLRQPERFDAWLHRLLVRSAIDETRRRRRRVIEVAIDPILAPTAEDPIGPLHDRDALERAMRRLSPDHRALIVLHYYLDMTLPDTADALGISLAAAKSRLHRAMGAMRQAMGTGVAELPAAAGGGHAR